ncbi:ribonuclease domain-containing protein, partial [Campylobacter concisus]|uniref:ribonuclease domain-containing protein n=2 Tax=Campylobacter concisus TaxID=199 RepID=UPI00292A4415
ENVAAGALSGAVNEAISSALHKDTSNMSTKEIEAYNNKRLLASQLIGIIAGGIANGDKGANTGYKITTSADTYNRQLHQRETDKIKELSEIYAKEKSISLDKATSIVAKAYYSSVDSDANDFYINNLSSDEAIEVLKAKEFIQDNLNSPNNHLVNGNDISNTSKKEYYDRYSNLQGYNDNKDFYKKYLSIKNQDDTLKFSSLDLASGFIKPYKDTFSYIVSDPLNSSKDILLGVINPIGSGYEYGHHLREIYEKASLDSFLKDEAGYNKHGGELAGNAVPAIALGGKGVKLVKDKLESAVIKQFDELNDGFKYSIPRTNSIANETLNKIENIVEYARKNNGTPPVGFKGGKVYSNLPKNGEQKLPDGVAYREYDINPYIKGVNRGSERIVIGSDKSIWYSFDHYKSFIRIE